MNSQPFYIISAASGFAQRHNISPQFPAWLAMAQNSQEKTVKKGSGAQIQNFLLYSRMEARIFQRPAVEPAGF